jgi:hypothetical protein
MGLKFQVLIVAIQAAAPLQDIGAVTSLITQARTIGAGTSAQRRRDDLVAQSTDG